MSTPPRHEHPRPDFWRNNWLSLNGEWDFSIGEPSYNRSIVVPFACETKLSQIEETGFHDTVYYRRSVTLPERMQGQQIVLHFGAVDFECRIWVDKKLAVTHTGGQTSFCADITPFLQPELPFTIEVEVKDDPFDLEMPRGKQYWEEHPRSIFYDRTTGIWQSVWLEAASPLHLEQCLITPLFDERSVRFDYILSQATLCTIEAAISFEGAEFACVSIKAESKSGSFTVQLDQSALQKWNFCEDLCWTPETPRLFDVQYRVLQGNGECDCVHTYFGMRKVSIESGVFMLNNRPYYQKLVLDQGYWPDSLMTAPDDDAFVQDIRLIKSMGFNGVRKHQKIEDPRFLYHADHMGLLVWGEIGSAYIYSRTSARQLYCEWQEAILRDYNHPCIIVWTPLNESWGVQEIYQNEMQQAHSQALYHLIRSLDCTRPVISNDGWEHTISDLLTIHDYAADGQTLSAHFHDIQSILHLHPGGRNLFAKGFGYQDQPILVSEYGGVKYAPAKETSGAWGYSEAVDATEFEAAYRALTTAILQSPDVQGFCYTQLTDVGMEENGLLTLNRNPKIAVDMIRLINEGK